MAVSMAVSTAVSPLRSLGAAAKRPLFNSKAPTLARPRRQISARHGAQFESSCSPSLRKDGRNHDESIMNPKDSMFSLCLFKEHLTLQCRRMSHGAIHQEVVSTQSPANVYSECHAFKPLQDGYIIKQTCQENSHAVHIDVQASLLQNNHQTSEGGVIRE